MAWSKSGLVTLAWLVVSMATIPSAHASAAQTGAPQSGGCDQKYLDLHSSHTMCLTDHPEALEVPLTSADKHNIVDLHNYYRAIVDPPATDMLTIEWDETLAATAQKWAMQCQLGHDAEDARKDPERPGLRMGQNMGAGHRTFDSMLSRFYSERDRFNYTYGQKNGTDEMEHFLQMVYNGTSLVGCGLAFCPHTDFVEYRVCNYAVRMSLDHPPYTNGTSCSSCTGHCDDGAYNNTLCDCGGKVCQRYGRVNPETCECECQGVWAGDHCEILNCPDVDPFEFCYDGRYTPYDCGNTSTYVGDPYTCPILCGHCEGLCGGLWCKGQQRLDPTRCECYCNNGLSGTDCNECPGEEPWWCSVIAMSNPDYFQSICDHITTCPRSCDMCV